MVVMAVKWNWYNGDIAGREEEMVEEEVVMITESGRYVVGVWWR